jgi:hypothetical protein
VAASIAKRCPDTVTVTGLAEAAQYQLMLAPGNSILFNKAGDPVATFKAHFIRTAAKDACSYFNNLKPRP